MRHAHLPDGRVQIAQPFHELRQRRCPQLNQHETKPEQSVRARIRVPGSGDDLQHLLGLVHAAHPHRSAPPDGRLAAGRRRAWPHEWQAELGAERAEGCLDVLAPSRLQLGDDVELLIGRPRRTATSPLAVRRPTRRLQHTGLLGHRLWRCLERASVLVQQVRQA
eukprot:scaffold571_cov225-Isochrysis_galbana.AAC.3